MRWLPRQQYMMDPIRVAFDKPIIQRMKPLNGILQIPAYYADTGTIFRGRLYWFPLIHRCQHWWASLIPKAQVCHPLEQKC